VYRASLGGKYGIAPIFFKPGAQYRGLRLLLEHLAKPPKVAKSPAQLPPAKIDEKYCWAKNPHYPDDPIKGRFGGLSQRSGWQISATIRRHSDDPYWFRVEVVVAAAPGSSKRLRGRVDFFVHDTFKQYRFWSFTHKKRAKCTFNVYGAFTIGALVHKDKVPLELDLAEVDGAPLDFQLR
jgi:hypothetical protein